MSELSPKSQKLADDLLTVVNKHDPELLVIIEATMNVLQSAIGQFAIGQGWTKQQAIAKAEEIGTDLGGMIEKNWRLYPQPRQAPRS